MIKQNQGKIINISSVAGKRGSPPGISFQRIGRPETELILKVKEPLPKEYELFHEEQILFTFLHLAADKSLTEALLKSKMVGISYETVQKDDGYLPLLAPMSEIAGRISPLVGSFYFAKHKGGSGKFIGGVPGVPPAKVVIIGGGTVGMNAAKMAAGMRAQTVILDINSERMRYLDDIMPPNVTTLMSNFYNLERILPDTDLLIGVVLFQEQRLPTFLQERC